MHCRDRRYAPRNDTLVTKRRQPLAVLDRDPPLGIGVDQTLFLEHDHRLIHALARCTDQVGDVALRQHNTDLGHAVLFVPALSANASSWRATRPFTSRVANAWIN